ncbi:hypothetical protein NP233_g8837 [Leucocoprinus birnbaumii]|uniref:Uncharacterized protein n=1 Tax=Leucocoprinus birnbaumii TaxID=56174 RepID=A0AAD5VS46_9AGAR|nr:hypothetical protein NP233_g8837 [Leucocoprinus birnbaumii]
MPLLDRTHILPNHPSTQVHADAVAEYLSEEVATGRMDGLFTQEEVESILRGPFQSLPLIVSVQPQAPGEPNKIRICRHLSKSSRTIASVNSLIKETKFPTRFDSVVKVSEAVAIAPEGTQSSIADISKYHRTCPGCPDHKCWLVVQGPNGLLYIDHNHPFGASCASSNAGMIGNAVVDIWLAEGIVAIFKIEDNFNIIRVPVPDSPFSGDNGFIYAYDHTEALRRIAPLGVPWHPEKGTTEFVSEFTFIGLRWSYITRSVSLPENKRLKYIACVHSFIFQFAKSMLSARTPRGGSEVSDWIWNSE